MNDINKLSALDIIEDLPSLWKQHPGGITIRMLEKFTGLPYHTVHGAIAWMIDNQKIKWVQRPDRKIKYIVPIDWEEPAWDLTTKQAAVLAWLISRMDEACQLTASFRDIAKGAGMTNGGICFQIDTLEKKGYMQTIYAGRGKHKSRFQIYPSGDGPQQYSPHRFQY